ncbi:MAG: hypothetical protein KI793_31700 [Rivularia sp. (in: Bacteria)]|nr:hypothetical protein [Rivularia sp. MS3]
MLLLVAVVLLLRRLVVLPLDFLAALVCCWSFSLSARMRSSNMDAVMKTFNITSDCSNVANYLVFTTHLNG